MHHVIPILFVIGPTASGKTAISYELAKLVGGQIINVDVGQFYAPLTIGTAKPDWRNELISSHLFDICTTPHDFTVVDYRHAVLKKVNELLSKGIVPILVGGSLFYVQSLFFPPREKITTSSESDRKIAEYSWQALESIDPLRAAHIHPHDTYRIKRALDIWVTTGQQPSQLEPIFNFDFPAYVLMVDPDKALLQERIRNRTHHMLEVDNWISEAAKCIDTEWESFIRKKGLIGYDLIFDALRQDNATPATLVEPIIQQTMQYAKRQMTFLRGFTKKILALADQKKTIVLHRCSDQREISYQQVARLIAYLQK